jgi:hypothetical protein
MNNSPATWPQRQAPTPYGWSWPKAARGTVAPNSWPLQQRLYQIAGTSPSIDLDFARTKTLNDVVTGRNLITFTRASTATFVSSGGRIKTAAVNEPRFDHNPTTGESLGLLIEEPKTNILLQSNQFDTTWVTANVSRTAAAGTAPDGTNTAWELKDTLDASATAHNLSQSVAFTLGTTYTFTVWMKAGTLSEGGISLPTAGFGSILINRINLSTGATITTSTNSTTSVTPFCDGWYRVAITATATATGSGGIQIRPMNGGISYTGTGTGTVLVWGAQLEAGAYVSSYIPTAASTVTRSVDIASISSTNFSSWFNNGSGVLYSDHTAFGFPTGNPNIMQLTDGTNNNRISLFIPSGVNHRISIVTEGVNQFLQNAIAAANVLNRAKVCLAFEKDNSVSAGNGSVNNTIDTDCIIPQLNRLVFGTATTGSADIALRINRVVFWPQRLPRTALEQITR